jgi:hypothetical protein
MDTPGSRSGHLTEGRPLAVYGKVEADDTDLGCSLFEAIQRWRSMGERFGGSPKVVAHTLWSLLW